MICSAKALLILISVGCVSFAQTPAAPAQAPEGATDKAAAYYNFAMGRVYA